MAPRRESSNECWIASRNQATVGSAATCRSFSAAIGDELLVLNNWASFGRGCEKEKKSGAEPPHSKKLNLT